MKGELIMNLPEIAMLAIACLLVLFMLGIILIVTLGLIALVDVIFDTQLIKRVKNWMFFYEESK